MPTGQDSENTAQTDSVSPQLARDDLYVALSATPRRWALYYLFDNETTSIDELATVLGGWAAADEGTGLTPAERENREIELRHVHLPLLDDTGLIEYDRTKGDVDLADVDESVRDLVRRSIAAEGDRQHAE